MANVANVTSPLFVSYAANLRQIPCVIDTGPYTTHECGPVLFRQTISQPIQGGDPNPLGPQRWPI